MCITNRFLPILALFRSPYLKSATEIVLEGLKEIGALTDHTNQGLCDGSGHESTFPNWWI